MLILQVNRISYCRPLVNLLYKVRYESTSSVNTLYPLEHRRLLKVSGDDASAFLQGLITNDMKHFDEGATCMYTMFLNNRGRVLYDSLIHKWDDDFMLECDKEVLNMLQKHLKLYKLKRKVNCEDVNEKFKLWALIAPSNEIQNVTMSPKSNNLKIYKDPRLIHLGFRILTDASTECSDLKQVLGNEIIIENNDMGYKCLRYQLGVGEGADDFPPASCFPLEVNCDYLHGVSFHKGCYIGQELTARVHHTGVVRKRLMPIKLENNNNNDILEKESVISTVSNPKANLGKLKGFVLNYGLGLLRVKEVLDAKDLCIGKFSVTVTKPDWWPIEAPKEKSSMNKIQ